MDESRPRRQTRLPLIIERPDLTHPLRRLFAVAATLFAWAAWIAMWLPFAAALAGYAGVRVPAFLQANPLGIEALFQLLAVTPYVLLGTALVMLVAYLRRRLTARRGVGEQRQALGVERLAAGLALDPQRLSAWQAMPILYVRHGPGGRVLDAGPDYFIEAINESKISST